MIFKKKKIVHIFTGKRGGFSHFIPLIKKIEQQNFIDYKLIVSDMHLSSEFGNTYKEIELYTKKIIKLKKNFIQDSVKNRLTVISKNIQNLSQVFFKEKPDYLILLGDRAEVLGAAIAAQFFNIPILHMYGGDVTQGGTDEPTRHAITKLSNIHLTSNKFSFQNVRQMGEEKWRIHNIGLSSIDLLKKNSFRSKKYLEKKYKLNFLKPYLLLIQHPVTWQSNKAKFQICETLKAIKFLNIKTIAIYPCSDPGYKEIIKAYKTFDNKDNLRIYKNINNDDFYSLLHYSSLLIGNSSCGITECGYLKKYVINIGMRQEGRISGRNVFNVEHDSKKIAILIKKILKKKAFKNRVNIYGDGTSANKILKIIKKNYKMSKLIYKKFERLN